MTDELWDRFRQLEGKSLDTATGKPFKVVTVTDRSVTVKPLLGTGTYSISRARFDEVMALGLPPAEMTAGWLFEKGISLPVYKIAILKEIVGEGTVSARTPSYTSASLPPLTTEQIDAVLAFLPALESPEADFGHWEGGNRQADGTIVMPYVSPSDLTLRLVETVYREGVAVDFDWPAWQPEAERLYAEPERLGSTDLETLRKLLTLHIRKDRFCEGHLEAMLKEGHITAILRRLKQVRDEMDEAAALPSEDPRGSESFLNIPALLQSLAGQRPVFHSEADFQHALAWEIHRHNEHADIRLEYRAPGLPERAHIDIWVREAGRSIAIELKYKSRLLHTAVQGEAFDLMDHSAQDIGRYDFVKDIERVERVVAAHPDTFGYAVLLTNDQGYWRPPRSLTTADAAFRVNEGRVIHGTCVWGEHTGAGTMKGREADINLRGSYTLKWDEYSAVGTGPRERFRYLLVPVR